MNSNRWAELSLAYGHKMLPVRLPASRLQAIVEPVVAAEVRPEADLLAEALANPIGTRPLRDLARAGQKVVIVTSDLTRPCPSQRLLPQVLDELAAAGVPDADITVVLALGLHRPMTAAEIEAAVGHDVARRVRVLNHDPADVVRLGVTSYGTPVELFRPVVEADLRVCLGNLELHYFAGYSGGAKAILPGCASRPTVNANHAMMARPEATAGRLDGNPVRADLEEGAAMVGVDFVLNVVVDGQHRIVGAVAGDVTAAHRAGCQLVAERGIVPIDARAGVVLVSAGGSPKDVNLYQAQKALDNAACAVQDGGVIVLVAECPEGLGNKTFESWMAGSSPDEILARIQQEFVLGGHKAAAVAAVLKRAAVYLVSALPGDLVRRCSMVPFAVGEGGIEGPEAALAAALDAALATAGDSASVLVLPQGGSVLPLVPA
jgi:nickel-dependent lactate racemase